MPLADEVAGELDRLFQTSRWQGDDDLVFADQATGEPAYRPGILKRFRKAMIAAHLDDAHVFHDLRHTFGTQMAAAGVPLRNGAGVDGAPRPRDDTAVRRLRAERARGSDGRGGVLGSW